MIDDNDETRWGSRWRGPVSAMQRSTKELQVQTVAWWLRQQRLASSSPSPPFPPVGDRVQGTRHWRRNWCEALWLARRARARSTRGGRGLPLIMFFVSETVYNASWFSKPHCAVPRLLWQTSIWKSQRASRHVFLWISWRRDPWLPSSLDGTLCTSLYSPVLLFFFQ